MAGQARAFNLAHHIAHDREQRVGLPPMAKHLRKTEGAPSGASAAQKMRVSVAKAWAVNRPRPGGDRQSVDTEARPAGRFAAVICRGSDIWQPPIAMLSVAPSGIPGFPSAGAAVWANAQHRRRKLSANLPGRFSADALPDRYHWGPMLKYDITRGHRHTCRRSAVM